VHGEGGTMNKRIHALLDHADAACAALLARRLLIKSIMSKNDRDAKHWFDLANDNVRYAEEFSTEANRHERCYGSVFPGVFS
jgi:hypothetical protein